MMKRKIIIAVGVTMLLGILPTWAQPKARAAQEENKSANELSVRAQTRYPGSNHFRKMWYGHVRFIVHWI